MIYVVLQEGNDPSSAEPFMAVSDPQVVRQVLRVIARHLDPDRAPQPLRPVSGHPSEDREP
jgi:hypothetical protein